MTRTIALLLSALLITMAADAVANEPGVEYLRDVKPLLRQRCFACHGALKQESGLRLDTADLIRRGGDGGPVVMPGRVEQSALIERIEADEFDGRMPPEGKPLTPEEIARIKAWVTAGAAGPEDEQAEDDPRSHWSFQAPVRPEPPACDDFASTQNPLDAFILTRLRAEQLSPRPPANQSILLRRLYLNVIGVPPSREELYAFLADPSPAAWAAQVDRLLNDPRYGERWGRHWMDVWRYSDWYGRRYVPDVWNSAPQIWRWRDWIVRSLNSDKGYDQLVAHMIAADEIVPQDREAGYATGYLIRNWYALNPNDWMRANVEHTGKAFLGLTFNCAHCHDHKYDPITHDDYFQLRAFFEPISIRQERAPGEADPGPFQEYEYGKLRTIQRLGAVRIYDKNPDAKTWFYTGGDERNRVQQRGSISPGLPDFLTDSPVQIEQVELPPRAWYPGLQPEIQQTVLAEAASALDTAQSRLATIQQTPPGASADEKRKLAEAEAQVAAASAQVASVEARIAADRAKYGETPQADPVALARAASLAERQAAHLHAQANLLTQELALAAAEAKPAGDAERAKQIEAATTALAQARERVESTRAAVTGESESSEYTPLSPTFPQTSTGRRRALAQWITSRQNPLTARVAINHIWLRHFHAPLVSTVYDFGRNGSPPSHPQLLDWLAVELIESGWSMKHIHRLILTSQAWQRTSSTGDAAANAATDPENRLLWRMNPGRMEAEVLRDSLLSCAGKLDWTIGGQELENEVALTTHRRSLYYSVFPEDGGANDLGELFDAPDPLDCYRRTRSIVPQQALALTNSELVHGLSNAIVAQWETNAHETHRASDAESQEQQFIVEAFERILSRRPSDAELRICRQSLAEQRQLLAAANASDIQTRARSSLVRALLNHNDFVTIR